MIDEARVPAWVVTLSRMTRRRLRLGTRLGYEAGRNSPRRRWRWYADEAAEIPAVAAPPEEAPTVAAPPVETLAVAAPADEAPPVEAPPESVVAAMPEPDSPPGVIEPAADFVPDGVAPAELSTGVSVSLHPDFPTLDAMTVVPAISAPAGIDPAAADTVAEAVHPPTESDPPGLAGAAPASGESVAFTFQPDQAVAPVQAASAPTDADDPRRVDLSAESAPPPPEEPARMVPEEAPAPAEAVAPADTEEDRRFPGDDPTHLPESEGVAGETVPDPSAVAAFDEPVEAPAGAAEDASTVTIEIPPALAEGTPVAIEVEPPPVDVLMPPAPAGPPQFAEPADMSPLPEAAPLASLSPPHALDPPQALGPPEIPCLPAAPLPPTEEAVPADPVPPAVVDVPAEPLEVPFGSDSAPAREPLPAAPPDQFRSAAPRDRSAIPVALPERFEPTAPTVPTAPAIPVGPAAAADPAPPPAPVVNVPPPAAPPPPAMRARPVAPPPRHVPAPPPPAPAPASDYNRLGLDYRLPLPRPKVRGPVIDFHCHLLAARHAAGWFEAADHYGVDCFLTMSPLEEAAALQRGWGDRLRFIAVPAWGPGAPPEPRRWADDFLRRLEGFWNLGSRVVKFHASPGTMRLRGLRLDDPLYRPLFREAVDRGMAVMTHIGDPDTWYAGRYGSSPQAAAEYGTREEHYRMWEGLLEEHRGVPWVGAHLGGNPECPHRLQGLLDRFPDLWLDCSATRWMVREVSLRRDPLREFLVRNQDRILFGSDQVSGDDRGFDFLASRFWCHRKLWETTRSGPSPISDPDLPPDRQPMMRGLALPDRVLQKIYHDNAVRFLAKLGTGFGGWG